MSLENLPGLYETEDTPFDEKVIYAVYTIPYLKNFYWLLAEYDPEEKIAFGYACLGDELMAEWGYIYMPEVESVDAKHINHFKPLPFPEAKKMVDSLDDLL